MNKDFIEGIRIISSYMPEKEYKSSHIWAEDGQVSFGCYDWITDEKTLQKLSDLGWDEDYVNNSFVFSPT